MSHNSSIQDETARLNLNYSDSLSVIFDGVGCFIHGSESPVFESLVTSSWETFAKNLVAWSGLDMGPELERYMAAAREGDACRCCHQVQVPGRLGSLDIIMQRLAVPADPDSQSVIVTLQFFDCLQALISLDQLGACAVLLGDDIVVQAANASAARLVGQDPHYVEGRNFALDCLASDDSIIEFVMAFEEVHASVHACAVERLDVRNPHRSEVSCDARLVPLDEHFTLCLLVDRTQEHVAASELFSARKSEVVYRVSAAVARDFNNLLAIIDGNLRFLANQAELDEPARLEALEDTFSAVSSGKTLNKRLLRFVSPESTLIEQLDLNRHILEFTKFAESLFPTSFRIECVENEQEALVDIAPVELESALLALCFNACDAIEYGQRGCLRVSTKVQASLAGSQVEVQLEDNGPGMEAEVLERCFEPFFTTRPLGVGNGMGLTAVRDFARRHGGDCRVASVPGEGTTVTLMLPVDPGAVPWEDIASASGEEPEQPATDDQTSDESRRVLVLLVDDDPRVRKVARRDLQGLGLEVVDVDSAEKALEVLGASSESIGLLISDVIMPPGIDGFELRRKVVERFPELPVVLISGYSHVENAEEVPYLIQKPYDLDHLREVIEQCLS